MDEQGYINEPKNIMTQFGMDYISISEYRKLLAANEELRQEKIKLERAIINILLKL